MPNVELKSINSIRNDHFYVPSYQRGFRWGKTELKELLCDLYEFNSNYSATSNPYEYCLQPIVVQKRDDGDWELVDGQQRLTALWLIICFEAIVSNSPIEVYELTYEKKEPFTKFLKFVKETIEENYKLADLLNAIADKRNESIDISMLSQAIDYFSTFSYPGKTTAKINQITTAIGGRLDEIQIIWYELDPDDNAIEFFTNLNANKILLKDSELIKAVLIHNTPKEEDKRDLANEWENIEKQLQDDDFWYFISGDVKKPIRIDFLFEIYCAQGLSDDMSYERYHIFHEVNTRLLNGTKTDEIWSEIKATMNALLDWYRNDRLYQLIGLLTVISDKTQTASLIKELFIFYSNNRKPVFDKEIIRRINLEFVGGNSRKHIAETNSKVDLENGITALYYGNSDDNEKIRKVLYLYNVATLIFGGNLNERIPFRDIKTMRYDIEHINPQTPDLSKQDDQREWLTGYKESGALEHIGDKDIKDNLYRDIEKCLNNNMVGFEQVASDIKRLLGIDEHYIGNLVLLAAKQNRSADYSNHVFPEKRSHIIKILRGVDRGNEPAILPGTRWAFLKEFDAAGTFNVWTSTDMDAYVDDIVDKIWKLIG